LGIVALPNNLLAEAYGVAEAANRIEAMRAIAQTIAGDVQSDFGFDQGDLTMLFMDMPDIPPQYTPIIVAQASQAQQQGVERTIGICHPIENRLESKLSAVNSVSPVGTAYSYLKNIEHRKIDDAAYLAAKMTLLQAPTHGELKLWEGRQTGRYLSADYNYTGPDQATVLVEIGDYKVKVVYRFVLMPNVPGSNDEGTARDNKNICPNGHMWKITTTNDASGNFVVSSIDYLPPTTSAAGATVGDIATLASTLGASVLSTLSGDTLGVNLTFADLPGAAVGQTTGSTITLDTNAAGYNWFIDTTPSLNEEYLPTSNPNEWVAKAGSAAAGKMDMLSVLLHEYGHALGINHSADPNDYMGTTLTAARGGHLNRRKLSPLPAGGVAGRAPDSASAQPAILQTPARYPVPDIASRAVLDNRRD
jgi:hypothetical protein